MTIILLFIAVGLGSLPTIKRVIHGDYHDLFWLMVLLDFAIIFTAIKTRNLVMVVVVDVIASTLINLLDQRRADQISRVSPKRKRG